MSIQTIKIKASRMAYRLQESLTELQAYQTNKQKIPITIIKKVLTNIGTCLQANTELAAWVTIEQEVDNETIGMILTPDQIDTLRAIQKFLNDYSSGSSQSNGSSSGSSGSFRQSGTSSGG
jgi:uncharacterized membrane protein YgcG